MAILNKKSMLFLLATTLLICSSHADDQLSSVGIEERAFNNKPFSKIMSWIGSEYPERVKKGLEFINRFDGGISALCTKRACTNSHQKCDGIVCVYKWFANKPINCQKDCSEERSLEGTKCHYDFKSGKVTGRGC